MTSNVEKRCSCGAAKWPKCADPWYLKKFRWRGQSHAPNLTRLAAVSNKTIEAKTEAEAFAEFVRSAIRLGDYVSAKATQRTVAPKTDDAARMLLGRPADPRKDDLGADALKLFDAEVINGDPNTLADTLDRHRSCLRRFSEFTPDAERGSLASWPLADITVKILIAFRRSAVLAGRANSTWAKYRTMIQMLFDWATANGTIAADPFKSLQPHEKRALKRGQSGRRSRRIDVVEEANLIRSAGRAKYDDVAIRLASLILAAIETGMRLGELLALQWGDVDMTHRTIYVAAREKGARKTGKSRTIPMSQRLHDELETLRMDLNGEPFGGSCYVFGDAVGGRVTTIKKAWLSCILHAHGKTPKWTKRGGSLTAASRAELTTIGLKFHDLRHEAGSRWLESRLFDLEQIRQIYGHKTVAQTANYLHGGSRSAMTAMAALDAARAELAKATKRATSNASADVESVHKLSKKSKTGDRGVASPRLVKSDKSHGEL